MSKDELGDFIKSFEVRETSRVFFREMPIVARLDGKAFHSFTKGMARPYDKDMQNVMDSVAAFLVKEFNPHIAYTQSDEITLIFLARDDEESVAEIPFGGKAFKLTSVLASKAASKFCIEARKIWPDRVEKMVPAFDCRCFEVASKAIAIKALKWREIDAFRNAVEMAARACFSHKQLMNKNQAEMQEMMFQEKGINFNDYPDRFKRGAYFQRKTFLTELDPVTLAKIPESKRPTEPVIRSKIVNINLPRIGSLANSIDVVFGGADPVIWTPEKGV